MILLFILFCLFNIGYQATLQYQINMLKEQNKQLSTDFNKVITNLLEQNNDK